MEGYYITRQPPQILPQVKRQNTSADSWRWWKLFSNSMPCGQGRNRPHHWWRNMQGSEDVGISGIHQKISECQIPSRIFSRHESLAPSCSFFTGRNSRVQHNHILKQEGCESKLYFMDILGTCVNLEADAISACLQPTSSTTSLFLSLSLSLWQAWFQYVPICLIETPEQSKPSRSWGFRDIARSLSQLHINMQGHVGVENWSTQYISKYRKLLKTPQHCPNLQ